MPSFLVFLVNQASASLNSFHYLYCTAQSWNPISNTFTLSSQRHTLLGCSHQLTSWTKTFLSIHSDCSCRKVELHLDTHEEAASQGPDRELHAALSQSLRKNQDAPAATAADEKMQGRFEGNAKHLEGAVKLDPGSRGFWRPRGQAHSELKEKAHYPHLKWKLLMCCWAWVVLVLFSTISLCLSR